MISKYQFGFPEKTRKIEIDQKLDSSRETMPEEYHGKYIGLPVIEIPIELAVYRNENIRTTNLQKEYLEIHKEKPKDLFTKDPGSIEAQEAQHSLLKSLAKKENLEKTFSDSNFQQKEAIICSDNGIVVNGNRRLCVWRELYYSNQEKYKHFETIRAAILPDHDPKGMYELEVRLQISSDMKAEYVWHAKAADCKTKTDNGLGIDYIAKKYRVNGKEINVLIECYDYAESYLESIGHPNEWSRVDKHYYAFKGIVAERKKIDQAGSKELFKVISDAVLLQPAKGGRLYENIPKIAKHLDEIADRLKEKFEIDIKKDEMDPLDNLGKDDKEEKGSIHAQIASNIRKLEDAAKVVETVESAVTDVENLENEKKKKSFVFNEVLKAATNMNNAVSNLDDNMTKDGIEKQIERIEGCCMILKDWVTNK